MRCRESTESPDIAKTGGISHTAGRCGRTRHPKAPSAWDMGLGERALSPGTGIGGGGPGGRGGGPGTVCGDGDSRRGHTCQGTRGRGAARCPHLTTRSPGSTGTQADPDLNSESHAGG